MTHPEVSPASALSSAKSNEMRWAQCGCATLTATDTGRACPSSSMEARWTYEWNGNEAMGFGKVQHHCLPESGKKAELLAVVKYRCMIKYEWDDNQVHPHCSCGASPPPLPHLGHTRRGQRLRLEGYKGPLERHAHGGLHRLPGLRTSQGNTVQLGAAHSTKNSGAG